MATGFKLCIYSAEPFDAVGVVFWEVRRFVDRLLINTDFYRWWKSVQLQRFERLPLASYGLDLCMMVPSAKSAQSRSRAGGEPCTELLQVICQKGWAFATRCCLFLLVEWSVAAYTKASKDYAADMFNEVVESAPVACACTNSPSLAPWLPRMVRAVA